MELDVDPPGVGFVLKESVSERSLSVLKAAELKIVRLLAIAAAVTQELSTTNTSAHTRKIITEHMDAFLQTAQEIHQMVREEIKGMPTVSPFENNSYSAKKDFEIAKMETEIIHAQLLDLLQTLQHVVSPSLSVQ